MRKTILLSSLLCLVIGWAGPAGASAKSDPDEKYLFDPERDRWIALEETQAPASGVVGEAQQLIDQQKYRQAERLMNDYLKQIGPYDPDRPQAMFLHAEAAFMRGEYGEADKRYRAVISEYPNTREYALALRRELDIAKAWLAGKRKRTLRILFVRATDEALDILSMIEQLAGGYRIAEVALWTKADYFYQSGQFELAEIAFRRLANEYRSPRYHKIALARSGASALAAFPGVNFDDSQLIEARQLYQQYLDAYPNEARHEDIPVIIEQIHIKQAEKQYNVARFYQRTRRRDAAAYYYRFVIRNWPETFWAERARLDLEELGYQVESED